jgi:phage tail P2-like protein
MIKELIQPSIKLLAHLIESADPHFAKLLEETIHVLIYSRIDELPEEVLDTLTWQFHIEGYEQAQTIQEKRNLIKHAIELHRYKGTPHAIKKVFQALNLEAELSEWFDYNGDPYKFKVEITTTDRQITKELVLQLKELIEQYKNVRSWLDDLILTYLNKISCPYQTADMAESFAEALLYFSLEHSASNACYHQTADMAEIGSCTEQLREFTFESKSTAWYQTANMAEVMSYAVMQ